MDYCTKEELVGGEALTGYLPQATSEDDQAKLAGIITRVSRRIDSYVTDGRAVDFFAPAGAASDLVVYGDGISTLTLPEFVPGSVEKVTGLHGVEITDYVERGTGIQLTDTAGSLARGAYFGEGIAYTVKAKWGFGAIPGDINEAALQLTVRTYRSSDEAFSGVIGGVRQDGSIIERSLPAAVKEILDVHRRKYRSRRLNIA
ncbi:MAG TPA: hypothetical protein VGX48_17680 [Pyrinomonadaceae bacterium]|jgi:hypothetical protein|nr:hypothetical protein [Pyrinomonadaceae bacterium]